jgi:hypothetical protein
VFSTLPLKRLALVILLIVLALSPSVVRAVTGLAVLSEARGEALSARALALTPPQEREAPITPELLEAWAPKAGGYLSALTKAGVSEARAARLLEQFWAVFSEATALLGVEVAAAAADVLTLEARASGDEDGRASSFATPEGSLTASGRWLDFIRKSRRILVVTPRTNSMRPLALALAAISPYPLEPLPVLRNARWIKAAGDRTYIPGEVLAAIIDNEQSGGRLAYGLSSALRGIADTFALQEARHSGSSGLVGRLSRTIGLTQMSWEDALVQRSRFHSLGLAFGVPFPQTEAQVRVLLGQPYANALLAASRLRGYLNADRGYDRLATTPHGVRAYWAGPAWHNRPDLASSGQDSAYAFHGFWKSALYRDLLLAVAD